MNKKIFSNIVNRTKSHNKYSNLFLIINYEDSSVNVVDTSKGGVAKLFADEWVGESSRFDGSEFMDVVETSCTATNFLISGPYDIFSNKNYH